MQAAVQQFIKQPFSLPAVIKLFHNNSLQPHQARQVLDHLKQINQISSLTYKVYLNYVARKGTEKEVEIAIKEAEQAGITSNVEWRDIRMQMHAASLSLSPTLSLLTSLFHDKKIALVNSEALLFVLKCLGTTKEVLLQLEKVWEKIESGRRRKEDFIAKLIFAKKWEELGDEEKATRYFFKVAGKFPINERTFWKLIKVSLASGKIHRAIMWFNEMKRLRVRISLVTYAILLRGLAANGSKVQVDHFYEEMKQKNVEPDLQIFNGIIGGMAKNGDIEGAKHWFEEMKKEGVEPDTVTFNMLINCAKQTAEIGRKVDVEFWLNEMKKAGIEPNEVTFTMQMIIATKQGEFEKAKMHWEEMKSKGVKPDIHSYNSLVHLAAQKGDYEEVKAVLGEMEKAEIKCDAVTFNGLLAAALKQGDRASFQYWYGEMKRRRILPNQITFLVLEKFYSKADNANTAQN